MAMIGARGWAHAAMALLIAVFSLGLGANPAAALTVEEIVSPKGIKAWLVQEHSVPLIALKFALAGGASQDPVGKEGLATMVADLLTEGAGDLTEEAFKAQASSLGIRLSLSAGRDAIYGGLDTLSKRFQPSAELLRLALAVPRFDEDAIERVRSQRLTDLAIAANEPNRVAVERWYQEAFPGNAYGRPADGTPASVARVVRDDLTRQHARLFARDVLKVVIVGDIDKAAAAAALDSIFGDLPERANVELVAKVEPRAAAAPVVVERDLPSASAAFGLASIASDHADFPALEVLNHIIGSGDFDAVLTEEIRVKRGLAYSVQTGLVHDSITSLLLGAFSTKNDTMASALGVLKEVLVRTARDGPSPGQFENAKRYLTGSFLLDFDTNAKVASSLLSIWVDGEGPDYLQRRNQKINAVTLADVKRVARDVLKTEALSVTIVGKPRL
ncbi:MAG TPA: pitrilysin family protein [Hyphomicrobiaceae bacterium]|nr:pitrilysin family protein [Hyphomicrobiaceae bacterium]